MKYSRTSGFTLVEMLVAVAIFSLVSVMVYQGYAQILQTTRVLKVRTIASNIANEHIEVIRNMPYSQVGTQGGIPAGPLLQQQEIERENNLFTVQTTIRIIDQPFGISLAELDGGEGIGTAKLVEVEVSCVLCDYDKPVIFNTLIAPASLESLSDFGTLRVRVLDAFGNVLPQAEVSIINNETNPTIAVQDVVGNNGELTLLGAPPSAESYQISVTLPGYSTDATYGETTENPSPIRGHATVSAGSVTALSFTIDELSELMMHTRDPWCAPQGGVGINLTSDILIGENPDVPKNIYTMNTSSQGQASLPAIEWGSYTIDFDTDRVWTGFSHAYPFIINPGSSYDVTAILEEGEGGGLWVKSIDQETGQSIADVTITLEQDGVFAQETSGMRRRQQFEWNGGGGQESFGALDRYAVDDGNIVAGESLELGQEAGLYVSSGELISSTFNMGPTTTFGALEWQGSTPSDSSIAFQIASSNSGTPTNFIGPDGTDETWYTNSGQMIHASHNNNRFMRYKVMLMSEDGVHAPELNSASIHTQSPCMFDGQVFFHDALMDEYTLTVSAPGYAEQVFTGVVNNSWEIVTIALE